jgi:hypothetical protein
VLSTVAAVGGNRRRRRHRRSKPTRDMTFGGIDNAAPAVDVGRFPELDSLGLEPCASLVPPPWIDPMLEEFATSHQEARPLLDTSSPGTVAQYMTEPPPSSPVQGTPPQTGPTVVVDEVALAAGTPTSTRDGGHATPNPSTPTKDGLPQATSDPRDAMPTSSEAAQHLTRFVEEVQVKRVSPPTRHSTKADGGNHEAPTNQEQTDCSSATGAHTDRQAG